MTAIVAVNRLRRAISVSSRFGGFFFDFLLPLLPTFRFDVFDERLALFFFLLIGEVV